MSDSGSDSEDTGGNASNSNGKAPHFPDEADDLAPWEPAPDHVAELAASCARFVMARYKVPLDGTSDTLSLLDKYIKDARGEITVKPETLELLSATIGAYLGEVVRRAFGGVWFADGEHDGWRLDMTRVFLTFNPLGMAREALTLKEEEGWHAHLEMDDAEKDEINRRLDALGEMGEDEYFLPSTRYDVIALAVDALRGKMIADGHADVTFGAGDYRKK